MEPKTRFEYRKYAFDRRITTFAIVNISHGDIREFLDEAFVHFERVLTELILVHKVVKVNTVFSAVLEKYAAAVGHYTWI